MQFVWLSGLQMDGGGQQVQLEVRLKKAERWAALLPALPSHSPASRARGGRGGDSACSRNIGRRVLGPTCARTSERKRALVVRGGGRRTESAEEGEAAVWNSMDRYTVTHMKALSIFSSHR